MAIFGATKDYGTGQVIMEWDGDRPTDEEFLAYAEEYYSTDGMLDVEEPSHFKGLYNPGIATVTPF